jgi:hypothetical protein
MLSMPSASLLFDVSMASWASSFVRACIPISPLCVFMFSSVPFQLLLLLLYYFYLVSTQCALSTSLSSVH